MEIPEDIEILDIIKMLMSVSEEVNEYINTQQYLCDVPNNDSLEEEGILTNCYRILIEELERKGIVFHEEVDEILASTSESERIYHLYCWIDPKHQIEMCKAHNELIEQLDNILNNDENEDDLIVSWAKCVSPIVKDNDPHFNYIPRILDYVHTTDNFKDMLNYVYTAVENSLLEIKQPMDVIAGYIESMRLGQEQAKKAFNVLTSHWNSNFLIKIKADKLMKYLDRYDLEKLQPPYINDFAWAWTIDEHCCFNGEQAPDYEDLPDDLKKKHDELDKEHHTTTDHHIEYYLAHPDIPIDYKALILLAIACYKADNPKITEEKFNNVINAAGDRFDKNCLSFFNRCKDILVAYAEGEIK